MKITNKTKSTILAEHCAAADTFMSRFMGLMGKKSLPAGHGLLITPCNSIHMLFMKFALDIVFIDKNNTVVQVIENIRPWKTSKIIWKAHNTLELPVGTVQKSGTQVGDVLEIRDGG
jgi:uncharacterized protein